MCQCATAKIGCSKVVIDSRKIKKPDTVRRRRVCSDCGGRFNTIEVLWKPDVDPMAEELLAEIGNQERRIAKLERDLTQLVVGCAPMCTPEKLTAALAAQLAGA